MEKIAIMVDAATDLGGELTRGHKIFQIPQRVIIDNDSYIPGVSISGEEVLQALESGKKVTTSLPTGEDMYEVFDEVIKEGYTHAIVISITSVMSGTYNAINNFARVIEDLEIKVIDTLNFSLGAGYVALKAAELVDEGKSFDEIIKYIDENKFTTNVFFTLKSVEYLRRGGRIGAVASAVATRLNICPIISVNDKGVFYTVVKSRGYRRAIFLTIDAAREFVKGLDNYRLALLHANSQEDFSKIQAYVKKVFDRVDDIPIVRVSPALTVHSGPEAIGLAVSRI